MPWLHINLSLSREGLKLKRPSTLLQDNKILFFSESGGQKLNLLEIILHQEQCQLNVHIFSNLRLILLTCKDPGLNWIWEIQLKNTLAKEFSLYKPLGGGLSALRYLVMESILSQQNHSFIFTHSCNTYLLSSVCQLSWTKQPEIPILRHSHSSLGRRHNRLVNYMICERTLCNMRKTEKNNEFGEYRGCCCLVA